MTHASLSDQFKAEHGPGAPGKPAPLTASRWPLVLNLPPEMKAGWPAFLPSRLALALHMIGAVPFDDSDSPLLRRGRYMERFGEDQLREWGYEIRETQVRHVHQRMNALTNLDVVAAPPGQTADVIPRGEIIEFKTVDERDYRTEWQDGPPLYPTLQVQCQMAITGVGYVQVGAIIRKYKGDELILHQVQRDEKIIAALERRGQWFLDLITSKSPEELAVELIEEDSPDSYRSWAKIINLPKGTTAKFLEPEAVERAKRLHEARRLKASYETIAEAEAGWFAKHAPIAERIELADGTLITRTVVKTPEKAIAAHVRPSRQHVTLKVKPAGEEAGDGA